MVKTHGKSGGAKVNVRYINSLAGIRFLVTKALIVSLRFLAIHSTSVAFSVYRRFSKRIWFFNLDCHISVIADLKVGLSDFSNVGMVSWIISDHNFVFRRLFKYADPVLHVSADTWTDLSTERKARFLKTYRTFLRCFDGFIVTYPPAFMELFEEFNRPILAVVATRYEHPFSSDSERWFELTETMLRLKNLGQLTLVTNNAGDSKYMEEFTGEAVPVVHSVCDYIPYGPEGGGVHFPIFAKSRKLTKHISDGLGAPWQDRRRALGANYGWERLVKCQAVIYIPYNNSTMSLFEFAFLGIPVLVPDPQFMRVLNSEFEGVLSEVLFPQKNYPGRTDAPSALADTRPHDLDWWLAKADFYDPELMPNVLQFSSFDDPVFSTDFKNFRLGIESLVESRNEKLIAARKKLLSEFIEVVGKAQGS